MATAIIIVQVEIPKGATPEDCRAYVESAVAEMKGCLHPEEDPMFNLDGNKVDAVIAEDSLDTYLRPLFE